MNRFALLTLLLLKTTVTTARTCYFPDGTEADSTYQPCNPDDDESACCALNKTNGAPNDICLDNGLCLSQDGQYSGIMFQNACTKESWGTDKCSHFCRVGGSSDGYFVLPCPGSGKSHWCCSDSGSDCCSGGAASLSMPALPFSSTSTASSSTGTSSATSTTTNTDATSTSTHSSTSTPEQCDDDSSATAIGAGLGVALAACFIGALAALYFQRRMYRRQLAEHKERLAQQYIPTPSYASPITPVSGGLHPPPVELTSTGKSAIYELGETRRESRQRF